MVDEKEKTRLEIELLKQEVIKDLQAFRGEFQGMTESLAAAKEATQESNAKLGGKKKHIPPAHRHSFIENPVFTIDPRSSPTSHQSDRHRSLSTNSSQERTNKQRRPGCCLAENMARCRPTASTIQAEIDEAVGRARAGGGGAHGAGRVETSPSVQPLSKAQRLGLHSNMEFWLILKKKNDFQAKAARVQELQAILEKIRSVSISGKKCAISKS